MKYFIKDLGTGFGAFIKLQAETILKNNSLINIGESYLVFTIGEEEETLTSENLSNDNFKQTSSNKEYNKMLTVKIFHENTKYDNPMYFD
jgi:hypothetical protein